MDKHQRFGRQAVRIMVMEGNTYKPENPNPDWKTCGEEWIQYSLNTWSKGLLCRVAYIPHIPLQILQGEHCHDVLPTHWDMEPDSAVYNFCMGGGTNLFRLNGRYKSPLNPYVGSRKNVDLSPVEDREVILELLKVAEKIYPPGSTVERPL